MAAENNGDDIELMEFLKQNFHNSSPNFQRAKETVDKLIDLGFTTVKQVRGDGNCLIRALLLHLIETRDKNIMFAILINFISIELIIEFFETKDDKIFEVLVQNIRDAVLENLNLCENVQQRELIPFMMDESAIDGFALEQVMRLLNVQKMTVHSLCPNAGEDVETVFQVIGKFLTPDVAPWESTLISAQGRCHYSTLLKS